MRGPIRGVALAALTACAVAALAGQASAATLGQPANLSFLAIYGNPPATSPVGSGLGRNFGFGENMLFQAGNGVGAKLELELVGGAKAQATESFIGGTLMSNKTGKDNPLSFTVQFVDFQDNRATNSLGELVLTPSYADTSDRPWITEICSPEAGTKCKTDAQFAPTGEGGVEIENVSFNIGPGLVVQGTVWGKWENGKEKEGKREAPCIKLETPAANVPTLAVTQTPGAPAVGTLAKSVVGKACLVSANNDWYKVGAELQEPIITVKNE